MVYAAFIAIGSDGFRWLTRGHPELSWWVFAIAGIPALVAGFAIARGSRDRGVPTIVSAVAISVPLLLFVVDVALRGSRAMILNSSIDSTPGLVFFSGILYVSFFTAALSGYVLARLSLRIWPRSTAKGLRSAVAMP